MQDKKSAKVQQGWSLKNVFVQLVSSPDIFSCYLSFTIPQRPWEISGMPFINSCHMSRTAHMALAPRGATVGRTLWTVPVGLSFPSKTKYVNMYKILLLSQMLPDLLFWQIVNTEWWYPSFYVQFFNQFIITPCRCWLVNPWLKTHIHELTLTCLQPNWFIMSMLSRGSITHSHYIRLACYFRKHSSQRLMGMSLLPTLVHVHLFNVSCPPMNAT